MRIALLTIAVCAMAGAVMAQEAIPETPPELRDFRLDPPPRSEAQPAPAVEPPPAVPTVEPQRQPAPRREEPPARARPAPERPAPQPDSIETPPVAETPDQNDEFAAEPATPATSEPVIDRPLAKIDLDPGTEGQPAITGWQWMLAALIAVLALLGSWIWWRRRNGAAKVTRPAAVKPAADPAIPPVASETIAGPATVEPVMALARRPRITLTFIPAKATLGFSSLTLKGRLLIANEGDLPARDLQLRSTMISANQRQAEIIAAFNNGTIPIDPNPIGDAGQGEQLALEIEMAVPINDIESYTVGEKNIFVPVILANVAYAWNGGSDNVTLACMVGRENNPPQQKMAPFRLDLGPRSFSPLGQRPVYA